MKRLMLVVVLVILCLLVVLPGCNSGDIWGSLMEAQGYIAIVGANMQSRGWDFPTDPVMWAKYIGDLKDSIGAAKSTGVRATGTVRGIERQVMAIPEPDMKRLNEAFDSNVDW